MKDNRLAATRWLRSLCLLIAALALAAVTAARATADTQTFGSDLSTVPMLDTANGAYHHTVAGTGPTVIAPNPHSAIDTSVWNASGPGALSAPVDGQILSIKLKGCAREDTSAPSQTSAGSPANEIGFQLLTPGGGSFTVEKDIGDDASGTLFSLPFCSHSDDTATGAVNTSTVTSYTPLHVCAAGGTVVDFHDIGGFIPATSDGQGPWYPQGVPFEVLAPQARSTIDSYLGGAALPGAVYSPSDTSAMAGWGSTSGEELQMQVVLGTQGDSYKYCPGGTANEPLRSNQVICDVGSADDGHPLCDASGNPASGTGTGGTKKKTGSKSTTPKLGSPALSRRMIRPSSNLTVSWSDTVEGLTTLTVLREHFGRRAGSRCVVRSSPRLRHAPVCRFFSRAQVVHHHDAVGRNSAHLVTRKLAPGSYRITIASHFGAHTSRTLLVKFKVHR